MKVLFKNSRVVVSQKQETYAKFGMSDATIEAFTSKYSADARYRGINYGSKKTSKVRFYVLEGGYTITIATGALGEALTTVTTMTGVAGWMEYTFPEPLPAGTFVLLNGRGVSYVAGTSKPTEEFDYYAIDDLGQGGTVHQQTGTGGSYPGMQLYMLEE